MYLCAATEHCWLSNCEVNVHCDSFSTIFLFEVKLNVFRNFRSVMYFNVFTQLINTFIDKPRSYECRPIGNNNNNNNCKRKNYGICDVI